MERKFSHFHISRLLVLFLNDIANILPVLLERELTWTAGEISKALWALSSNLPFSQGLSVPQDGRINPNGRSAWLTVSIGLAGEMPVRLHCLRRHTGPSASGLCGHLHPDYEGQIHVCWCPVLPCHWWLDLEVDGCRLLRASSFPVPSAVSAELPLVAAWHLCAHESISSSEGTKRLSIEATCLLPSSAQPWGWCAFVCILCFPGAQWPWTAFQLC